MSASRSSIFPENQEHIIPENQEDNPEGGLTDKQLADELGLDGSTCYRWRKGKAKPRGENSNLFQEWEIRGNRWYRKETTT